MACPALLASGLDLNPTQTKPLVWPRTRRHHNSPQTRHIIFTVISLNHILLLGSISATILALRTILFHPPSIPNKMPIRNPFAKRQADDGLRPPLTIEPALKTPPGFERVDTVGSKASSALSISSRRSQDTGEYKMSGTFARSFRPWIAQPLNYHLPAVAIDRARAIDARNVPCRIVPANKSTMLQWSMTAVSTCRHHLATTRPRGLAATCRAPRRTRGANR